MGTIATSLRSGAAGFFGWWFGELAQCVPSWIQRLFQGTSGAVIIDLSDGGLVVRRVTGRGSAELGRIAGDRSNPEEVTRALASLLGRGRGDRVLRLPNGNALRKSLDLPAAAAENMREVLGFEMDRQTPFTAAQVYFDYRIVGRDTATRRMTVELVAIPRAEVDAALQRAAGWGFVPDVVDIAGEHPDAAPTINLLSDRSANRRRRIGGVTLTLSAVAAGLAIAAVLLPLERERRAALLLAAEAERARAAAMVAVRLREDVELIGKETAFLSERRRGSRKAVEIIDEITRLVPDHTWLQQLRIQATEIRLTGLSDAASSLVGIIESSPLFQGARFRAPVTQDTRSGKERFTLSATIIRSDPGHSAVEDEAR